jgi:hypothetical protein
MRLPRLRLRLRTLLIAVAVMGLALGGWTMWRRREFCLERAQTYANTVSFQHQQASHHEQLARLYRDAGQDATPEEGRAAGCRAFAEWAYTLGVRYRHVARYPWLPMPRGPE